MASQIWSNSTDYVNCADFQLVFNTSTIPKINLFNIYNSKFDHRITMSGWPSGLRRQTQEQYSSLTIERSGPRMRAWVRIPLLTKSFFLSFYCIVAFISFGHFHSPKCSLGSFHDVVSIDERDGLTLFFAVRRSSSRSTSKAAFSSLFSFFWEMDGGEAIHCSSPLCLMRHGRREMSPTSGLSWSFVVTMSTPLRLSNWQSSGHWAYPSPLRDDKSRTSSRNCLSFE